MEGVAVVAAVLATMATSRPRYEKHADLPPSDASRARIVVVEASEVPVVELGTLPASSGRWRAAPLDPQAWPGRNRYLVPAGVDLIEVMVSGRKRCSGICGSCEEPAGTRVTVAQVTPVQAWTLGFTTGPQETLVPAGESVDKTFRVTGGAGVHVWVTGDVDRVSTWRVEDGEVRVTISALSKTDVTVSWGLAARLDGPCPDPATPCEPPPGTTLTLEPLP